MSTKTKSTETPAVETEAVPVDLAPVRAVVEAAVADWTAGLDSVSRSIESAAVAAYAASPFISEEGEWTSESYRKMFPAPRPDKAGNVVSVSKSTLSLWTLLGRAHSLGVTPDAKGQTWKRLVQRATDKRISSAIRDDKATAAKITTAVNKCYPKGQYAAAAVPTPGSEDETDATHGNTGGEGTSAPAVADSTPGMLSQLEAIAARLDGKPVTKAEYERLAPIVEVLGNVKYGDTDAVEASRAA